MVLTIFLAIVFFICLAMLWTEGLWGNAVTFVNLVISAMVAISFWEKLANYLEDQMSTFTYLWDILSVWLIFAVTMGILRALTGKLSKYKVRFHILMESIGNLAMAAIVATTMSCFVAWTIHMAPLAPKPFRGVDLRSSWAANTWIGLMRFSSSGTLKGGPDSFPSDGYAAKYQQRRDALATLEGFRTND